MRWCAALFFLATTAFADKLKLRLDELPRVTTVPRLRQIEPVPVGPDNSRFERAVWLIAQRIAEPHSRLPAFVPLLGRGTIGGSLQLDF